jgi:hypothetical protein
MVLVLHLWVYWLSDVPLKCPSNHWRVRKEVSEKSKLNLLKGKARNLELDVEQDSQLSSDDEIDGSSVSPTAPTASFKHSMPTTSPPDHDYDVTMNGTDSTHFTDHNATADDVLTSSLTEKENVVPGLTPLVLGAKELTTSYWVHKAHVPSMRIFCPRHIQTI